LHFRNAGYPKYGTSYNAVEVAPRI